MDEDNELYIDPEMLLDTQDIPNMSDEEADGREYEDINENEEGGL